MIKISYIEENLDKLNSVYSLISLLDVHYSISHHSLSDNISKAKDHLSKAIACLALEISEKLKNLKEAKNHEQISAISKEINSALQDLKPFFATKELKNSEVLKQDALEVLSFLDEYEKEDDFDLSNKEHLKTLREKLMIFVDDKPEKQPKSSSSSF